MNRFQNKDISGIYLYAGEQESTNIRANYSNFVEEGVAFYVYDAMLFFRNYLKIVFKIKV
jgi:peptidyl-prolyl cis-trans isomerase A (cyclophilin A)